MKPAINIFFVILISATIQVKNYGMGDESIKGLNGEKHTLTTFFQDIAPKMKNEDVVEVIENNLRNNKNIGTKTCCIFGRSSDCNYKNNLLCGALYAKFLSKDQKIGVIMKFLFSNSLLVDYIIKKDIPVNDYFTASQPKNSIIHDRIYMVSSIALPVNVMHYEYYYHNLQSLRLLITHPKADNKDKEYLATTTIIKKPKFY